jgi:crotonobetainyl-CoA:carnitine CoA-transferase CaiB-like acyl-CoA transferase
MSGPLSGIRIVDLTAMASGPFATSLLGDQGADVIKIEPPGGGDLIRRIGNSRNGMSAVFANLNRSKRSLVLNLREPRGIELLLQLADSADVFVQNFRPGVAERMGFGPETLRARNPRLITVSITGFGRAGDDANRRVYDSVMQAYAGYAAHQADPKSDEPAYIRNVVCDKSTALTTAQAITAALFARDRRAYAEGDEDGDRSGQHLDISMLHASIAFLWPDGLQNYTWLDGDPGAMPRATLPAIRRTADSWVAISTVGDAEWRGLCRALGRPELQQDPRFAEAGARARNAGDLHEIVVPLARAMTTAELVRRLIAEDVPHASVTPLAELHEHPQVVANQLLREDVHPVGGRMRSPEPVGDFDRTPLSVERLAPTLGEHSDELLAELGVSPSEIDSLRQEGIVE